MPTLTPEEALELQRAADSIALDAAKQRKRHWGIGGKRPNSGRKSPVGGTMQISVSKEAGMRIKSVARRTGRTMAQVVDARDW